MTIVGFINIQRLILDLRPVPQTRILFYPENFRALTRLHCHDNLYYNYYYYCLRLAITKYDITPYFRK